MAEFALMNADHNDAQRMHNCQLCKLRLCAGDIIGHKLQQLWTVGPLTMLLLLLKENGRSLATDISALICVP